MAKIKKRTIVVTLLAVFFISAIWVTFLAWIISYRDTLLESEVAEIKQMLTKDSNLIISNRSRSIRDTYTSYVKVDNSSTSIAVDNVIQSYSVFGFGDEYKDKSFFEVFNTRKNFGALNYTDFLYRLGSESNSTLKWSKDIYAIIVWKTFKIDNRNVTLFKLIDVSSILQNKGYYTYFYITGAILILVSILSLMLAIKIIELEVVYSSTKEKLTDSLSFKEKELKDLAIFNYSILHSLSDFVWLKDVDGKYIYLNNKAPSYYCLDEQPDFIGKTEDEISTLVPSYSLNPTCLNVVKNSDKQVLLGQPSEFQLTWYCDGVANIYAVNKVPMYNSDARLVGILGTARDITEQVNTEVLLRHERSLWETSFNNSPDVMLIVGKDGSFYKLNKACSDMLAANNIDLAQHTFFSLVDYLNPSNLDESTRTPIVDLIQGRSSGDQASVDIHAKAVNKIFNVFATKLKFSDRFEGFLIIARDITEYIRTSRSLAMYKQYLVDIINAVPHFIFAKDEKLRYVMVNRSFVKFLGEDNEKNVLGKTEDDFYFLFSDPESTSTIKSKTAEDLDVLHNQRKAFTEEVRRDSLGVKHIFETIRIPLTTKYNKPGILTVSTDVTKLVNAKEALSAYASELEFKVKERTKELEIKNKDLDSFNHTLAHDLRNSLRQIDYLANSVLISKDNSLAQGAVKDINLIKLSIKNLTDMLEGMLSITRNMPADFKCFKTNISEIVLQIFEDIKKGDKDYTFECMPDMEDFCDARLIKSMYNNFLSNAWKFSKPGERLDIKVGRKVVDGKFVYYVTDNGLGFPAEKSASLFKMFTRLHKEVEGTGIGLTVVKKIVDRHYGNVWCESNEGEGTSFYYTLGTTIENCNEG